MLTPALTNEFLLKSAQKQLGFKPTAQVSLNDVDTIVPHQRCLSEQLVLMTSFPHSIPYSLLAPLMSIGLDGPERVSRRVEETFRSLPR